MLREAEEKVVRDFNQNPYLFIVGCPRSGTTLLRRIVNAHPDIAMTPESHWIPSCFEERKGLTPEGFVTPDLIPELVHHPKFKKLRLDREELEGLIQSNGLVSYATFVTAIFNLFGKVHGKPLVGDKTPGYARKIRTLHGLWPTARFVHLIRDGRNVCLSAINWTRRMGYLTVRFPSWIEYPVSTAALWWEWHVRLAREAGSSLGRGLYYEMRYESLVTNPAKECQALCEFLAVPYDEAMLRFYEGRTKKQSGLDAKHAWLPVTPGLRDWRSQMSAENLKEFEAVAGDLLEELGYARSPRRPEPKAQEHASVMRQLFSQNGRFSSKYELPEHWTLRCGGTAREF